MGFSIGSDPTLVRVRATPSSAVDRGLGPGIVSLGLVCAVEREAGRGAGHDAVLPLGAYG